MPDLINFTVSIVYCMYARAQHSGCKLISRIIISKAYVLIN